MKYNYSDIGKVIFDANELLKEQGSTDELRFMQQACRIGIFSIDGETKEKITHVEFLNRDEAYYWVCGFNTGILNKA